MAQLPMSVDRSEEVFAVDDGAESVKAAVPGCVSPTLGVGGRHQADIFRPEKLRRVGHHYHRPASRRGHPRGGRLVGRNRLPFPLTLVIPPPRLGHLALRAGEVGDPWLDLVKALDETAGVT